jgi:methylated-DNA-[protein]-cysteine S-methyltransferase
MVYFAEYASPVGMLCLTSNAHALTGLRFGEAAEVSPEEYPILRDTKQWLDGYFRGENLPLQIPLAPEGTDFQKRVWRYLREIPWGETRTYGELARELAEELDRKSMSAQAVGQAVGNNPIAIVIPCHRVVGTGGKLTGYAWGIDRKQWLLRHETTDHRRNEK